MLGSVLKGVSETIEATPSTFTDDLVAAPKPKPVLESVLGPESPYKASLPHLDDVVDRLRKSPLATGVNYRDTAEKVKAGAFAVTADITDKGVGTIRETLAEALEQGLGKDDFIELIATRLEETSLAPNHVETIFRTNAMSALSEGKKRALDNPLVTDAFPYVAYSATHDARVRPEHKALETLGLQGTNLYRSDDPTIRLFWPPWSYNCRCAVFPQTVTQAAAKGVKEAMEWIERAKALAASKGGEYTRYLGEAKPMNPEYVSRPDFAPEPEFQRIATS